MIVKTTYKTNAAGRSQIVAKAGGKQRTVNFDQSRSLAENHGEAAGAVLLAHGWDISMLDDHRNAPVDFSEDGVRATFTLTYKV